MDVREVERVVRLRARSHAACLCGLWQREHVEVRPGVGRRVGSISVVVAIRRPQHRFAQHVAVGVEHCRLVLVVEAILVGVVAEHQPQIGVARARKIRVGVAHRARIGVRGAGVSDDPHPHRPLGPGQRRGLEPKCRVTGKRSGRGSNRVVVERVWYQPFEPNFVLGARGGLLRRAGHDPGRRPELHPSDDRRRGAPAHDDAGRRTELQVRAAEQSDRRTAHEFKVEARDRSSSDRIDALPRRSRSDRSGAARHSS